MIVPVFKTGGRQVFLSPVGSTPTRFRQDIRFFWKREAAPDYAEAEMPVLLGFSGCSILSRTPAHVAPGGLRSGNVCGKLLPRG